MMVITTMMIKRMMMMSWQWLTRNNKNYFCAVLFHCMLVGNVVQWNELALTLNEMYAGSCLHKGQFTSTSVSLSLPFSFPHKIVHHLFISFYDICPICLSLKHFVIFFVSVGMSHCDGYWFEVVWCNLSQFVAGPKPGFMLLFNLQVLQGGGLESPTKPKGRPKKNSIPSSEQLSEQERSVADADRHSEGSSSHLENTQEEWPSRSLQILWL